MTSLKLTLSPDNHRICKGKELNERNVYQAPYNCSCLSGIPVSNMPFRIMATSYWMAKYGAPSLIIAFQLNMSVRGVRHG